MHQLRSRPSSNSRSMHWPTLLLETHPSSEIHCQTQRRRKRFVFSFTVYMVLTHIGYLNRLVSGSIKDHLFFSPFSTVYTLLTSSPSLASEAHKSSCPESPDYPYSVQTDPSSCHPCSSQSSVLLRLLQISAL